GRGPRASAALGPASRSPGSICASSSRVGGCACGEKSARCGHAPCRTSRAIGGRDEETARTLDADGLLRTGDAGYLDEEGYLFPAEGVKDIIICGGETVCPAGAETALPDPPPWPTWPSSTCPTRAGARPSRPSSCGDSVRRSKPPTSSHSRA